MQLKLGRMLEPRRIAAWPSCEGEDRVPRVASGGGDRSLASGGAALLSRAFQRPSTAKTAKTLCSTAKTAKTAKFKLVRSHALSKDRQNRQIGPRTWRFQRCATAETAETAKREILGTAKTAKTTKSVESVPLRYGAFGVADWTWVVGPGGVGREAKRRGAAEGNADIRQNKPQGWYSFRLSSVAPPPTSVPAPVERSSWRTRGAARAPDAIRLVDPRCSSRRLKTSREWRRAGMRPLVFGGASSAGITAN